MRLFLRLWLRKVSVSQIIPTATLIGIISTNFIRVYFFVKKGIKTLLI